MSRRSGFLVEEAAVDPVMSSAAASSTMSVVVLGYGFRECPQLMELAAGESVGQER
jgi:hypothetical protein